ncbi:MAG: restriction endonuclease subunit M [Candidatus Helarchaeota archaeon]
MTKESYIDSEIYRFFKNLQEQNVNINGLTIRDVKFHYPINKGEADIYIVLNDNNKTFSIIVETKRNKKGKSFDPYSPKVIGQALGYAKFIGSKFIITSNGDLFLCFDITKNIPILQCIVNEDIKLKYTKQFFLNFLRNLKQYLSGKRFLKTISDRFIERLAYFHELITPYFKIELKKRLNENDFKSKFIKFSEKRGYTYNDISELVRWISEQSAYLLLNRLLFYGILKNHYPNVPPIKKINGISINEFIQSLNSTFKEITEKINYQIIFQKANIFDEIPISSTLAFLLNDFIEEIEKYDVSLINEDVIGKVYELIIPEIDKHLKGQYYTPQWIADLIAELTIKTADDKILDTSCGSGTFLISAYKKLSEFPGNGHSKIIDQLTGIDINYFPAHLAALNLIIRDITKKHDNLKILPIDFFKLRARTKTLIPLDYLSLTSNKPDQKQEFSLTAKFDAIITNPPYTESREIGDARYKNFIRKIALDNPKQLAGSIGIHGYFYTHANHFLKNKGRIGFIVSNSFLETKSGRSLCKFFLDNFKIRYLIGFKKNIFEYADVKAIITVLEKNKNEVKRDNNFVKFIKILTDFNQLDLKKFANIIRNLDNNHKETDFSLIKIKQEKLKEDFNWMLYFREFDLITLFLKIFNKDLIKLTDLCGENNIRSCFKSGGYEFFFIKKEDNQVLKIEKQYLDLIIHSPRDFNKLAIKKLDITKYLLKINSLPALMKTNTNAKRYFKIWMEKEITLKKGKLKGTKVKGIQNTPTFKGVKTWYKIFDGQLKGDLLFQGYINKEMRCFINECNAYSSANYVTIKVPDRKFIPILALIYNSSLMQFYFEIKGTVLGANALYVANYQLSSSKIPNLNNISQETFQYGIKLFKKFKETQFTSNEFTDLKQLIDDFIFDLYLVNEQDRLKVKKYLNNIIDARLKGKS